MGIERGERGSPQGKIILFRYQCCRFATCQVGTACESVLIYDRCYGYYYSSRRLVQSEDTYRYNTPNHVYSSSSCSTASGRPILYYSNRACDTTTPVAGGNGAICDVPTRGLYQDSSSARVHGFLSGHARASTVITTKVSTSRAAACSSSVSAYTTVTPIVRNLCSPCSLLW